MVLFTPSTTKCESFGTVSSTKCESVGTVSLEEAVGPFLCVSFSLFRFEILHIKASIKINCGKYKATKNPSGS